MRPGSRSGSVVELGQPAVPGPHVGVELPLLLRAERQRHLFGAFVVPRSSSRTRPLAFEGLAQARGLLFGAAAELVDGGRGQLGGARLGLRQQLGLC